MRVCRWREASEFQAAAYPGYKHARTLGVVRNKKGEATGGGWKGRGEAEQELCV